LSTIHENHIERCEIVAKNSALAKKLAPKYVSNRIQYVGNKSFADYFESLLTEKSVQDRRKLLLSDRRMNLYMQKLLETHLYLLHSVKLLTEHGIAHLDMKENNIMYDEKNDVFIMIDFGISVDRTSLDAKTYVKESLRPFGVMIDYYKPWCIEIILLSYIAKQITNQATKHGDMSLSVNASEFQTKKANVEIMKRLCTLYVSKSDMLQSPLFSKTERKEFETRLHKWLDGFTSKTWEDTWTAICSSIGTWDNYGLAIVYLDELIDCNMIPLVLLEQYKPTKEKREQAKEVEANPPRETSGDVWSSLKEATEAMFGVNLTEKERRSFHFLTEYTNILKEIVLAIPSTRKTPAETSKEIQSIFTHLDKKSYVDAVRLMNTYSTRARKEAMKKRRVNRTLIDLETDRELHDAQPVQ
jgi:serine/threonine protein kinase